MWKQFLYYLNDVSPVAFHSKEEIQKKELKGIFIGGDIQVFKIYLKNFMMT
jgi:peptide/nickel transport system permease protein